MKYTIGIDFGSESGRALLVDVATGRELATSVHFYKNGVITETLPGTTIILEPDWALQDPNDYLEVLKNTVPAVLLQSGVAPGDVIGISIDFTACTMLPTTANGTPLCSLAWWQDNPHAWVKLWKHHAAQPEADAINELARQRQEPWLKYYGGKISSEWFFAKSLQILNEAPEVYHNAERLIEAADWIVWQLTGRESRNLCTAGYKAIWQKEFGFPSKDFFAALHPEMADIVDTKMRRDLASLGDSAGGLTAEAAAWTGLLPGTVVAVANVDAHVTVAATGTTAPGTLVMIMGTSTCDVLVGESLAEVPGMCGVVADGIVPGYYGYEAGQSGVGDIFAWFVENGVPTEYVEEAKRQGVSTHTILEQAAVKLNPGQHGLIALDWWNGNRSTLVDAELGGLILGMTLNTKAPEIYRALIEATAFGTREIIETFENNGVPIHALVAAGGLPERNPLLMQIYSDVLNRPISLVRSSQAPALGSAIHAAVAAGPELGGYATIREATAKMGGLQDKVYKPVPENVEIYNALFAEYKKLYDYFGRGENAVMKRLREIRNKTLGANWLEHSWVLA